MWIPHRKKDGWACLHTVSTRGRLVISAVLFCQPIDSSMPFCLSFPKWFRKSQPTFLPFHCFKQAAFLSETVLWMEPDWQDFCHWKNTAEWTFLGWHIPNSISFLWFVLLKWFDMPHHAVYKTRTTLNKIRIPAEPRWMGSNQSIPSVPPGCLPFILNVEIVTSLSFLYNLCCFPTTNMATSPFPSPENIWPGDLFGHLWPRSWESLWLGTELREDSLWLNIDGKGGAGHIPGVQC